MNLSRIRNNTEKFHSIAVIIDKHCNRLDNPTCFSLEILLPSPLKSKRRDLLTQKIVKNYRKMISLKEKVLLDVRPYPDIIELKTIQLEEKLKEVHTRILLCQMATLTKILPEERGEYETIDLT